MISYLILIAITASLAWATVRVVKRTGQWTFAVGMAVLYAWTFLGAWFFIGDALSGYQGYRIGLNYYYLMEKMFPFELDPNYHIALLGYSAYAALVMGGVWVMVRRIHPVKTRTFPARTVDHRAFFLVALVAALGSFAIIRPVIMDAVAAKLSIYQYTRHAEYTGASIHGLCNELVCLALLLGWVIHLTGRNARFFTAVGQRWAGWAYPAALLVFSFYLMLLGNRHELFMALILGSLVFFANAGIPRGRQFSLYLAVVLVPLMVTGKVRNLTWQEMSVLDLEGNQQIPPFTLPIIQHVPRQPKGILPALGERVISNEFFCAHFSLYGILRKDVRPEPFISAQYIAASMVPRLLQEKRPPTAYDYYAEQARLMPDQGYTIHQAAGWYINGGWGGLAIGALLLGLFWGWLMRLRAVPPSLPLVWHVFAIMGTSCLVAFMPILIRDGPEIVKALVFEGFAMPIGIVLLAVFMGRKRTRRKLPVAA
ncbi:MAG: hypothetical protein LKM36_11515 [Flavobacteriales bacterium]|jgi:hypothetical protein|nr:hypothetical protein [Flavobacteriales bacterium]MBP9159471.1 hypothetical protein [Flavobacteriales bacterium]MCI1753461.1 hypothetical protein [Flavobacteriales bacterium]